MSRKAVLVLLVGVVVVFVMAFFVWPWMSGR